MDIHIKVKTNARAAGIEYDEVSKLYIVSVVAIPVEGKANSEVIKLLAKKFDIAKSLITIKSGQKSSLKAVTLNK